MILLIINYLLIFCAAVAGISGPFFIKELGIGDGFEAFAFAGVLVSALALLFILWRAIAAPSGRLGTHYFLWAAVFVLVSRSVFPAADQQVFYAAFLFVSVLLPALVRSEPVWIAVFAFASLSYSAQMAVEGRVWVANDPLRDPSLYYRMLQFAGASLLGGLIPWLVLKRRGEAREKEFNKTLEEVRSNAISDGMARKREQPETVAKKTQGDQMSTAAMNANTIALNSSTLRIDTSSTDTFTLLNDGGENVNVQLKSMLFFMRYNFKALTASAFIYDSSRRVLVLNCYETKGGVQIKDKTQIPLGISVIGQVASDNRLFMSGDLSLYQASSADKEFSYYVQNEGVSSILASPIVSETGAKEFLGVLAVDSVNKNAFTEHDKELMRRFSIIAAALIVNIRMSVTLEHDAKMFETFYNASHGFSVALKMEEIFDVLMGIIPQVIPACGRLVYLVFDTSKNCLRIQRIAGTKGELAEGMEFLLNSGLYSFAFIKNKVVNIPDFQASGSKYFRFTPDEPRNPATRTLIVFPIMGGEGHRCIGLFSVESSMPDIFKKEIERLLTTIIENASVAITRSLLYSKMEKLATTDGLTGLNNHRTFQEIMQREFERAKRHGRPLSLLLTDIDHFKKFNDTYGHPVGDLVLREIAAVIRQTVRLNDFPARYGGEEFAVILPETDPQGAFIIADRVRQVIEQRVINSGTDQLRVTISIGCVTYPAYGTTQQEIIDCADKALYTSKRTGRNRVTMYSPGMTVASK